ncbi:MAG: hypothetical protein R6W87_05680 [Halospina sp.]
MLHQERLDPVVVTPLGDAIGAGGGFRRDLEAAAEAGCASSIRRSLSVFPERSALRGRHEEFRHQLAALLR